jgi:hypothetical protein
MQILPRQTLPPKTPIDRQHNPKVSTGKSGYQKYRECLRWEFGFTCPFCLLHEADLARAISEGTAQTAIEHFEPQSTDKAQRNKYSNCFYICRFCNTARSNLSVTSENAQLLNPTIAAWSNHFELNDGKLLPLDGDAAYTEQSYDINDPRRIMLKTERAKVYDDHFLLIEHSHVSVELIDLAKQQTDVESQRKLIETAAILRNATQHAIRDLQGYSIVPADAPTKCQCKNVELELPEGIARQAVSLKDR